MRRVKVKTYAGSVCEQEVFTIADNKRRLDTAESRQWFRTEEERAKHEENASRRRLIGNVNATFTKNSLYCTLTMSNEYEVHTFEEAERMENNFIRRIKYKYPEAQIVSVKGRGKGTNRIHFHMLINGVPEEVIREKWIYGDNSRIVPMREHNYYNGIDHGQDYTALANYLFDHWTPEQGKHRWRQTRNINRPEREVPSIIKRVYTESKPPRAPKGFMLVETKSNQFGYLYFKYVREPEKKRRSSRMNC